MVCWLGYGRTTIRKQNTVAEMIVTKVVTKLFVTPDNNA